MIRNASTNQFRAVTTLAGRIRWCLTGTPIQNSLDDLGSLVSFLRVPILKEATQFRRYVTRQKNSIQSGLQPNYESLRLLLGAICLRRNKTLLHLSRCDDLVHEISLSKTERKAYVLLGHVWREALDMAVGGHRPKEAHQTVLEALLRMRIYCNNGDFFGDGIAKVISEPDEIGSLLQQKGKGICYQCSCDIPSFGHSEDSSSGSITSSGQAVCGECRGQYEEETISPTYNPQHMLAMANQHTHQMKYQPEQDMRNFPPKLKILRKDIESHITESKR